jgi:rhodanese-related sulfurtransferase
MPGVRLGWATGIPSDVDDEVDAGEGEQASRPSVGVAELRALLDSGEVDGRRAVLLDVREAGERAVVALPGGAWLPVGEVRAGAAVDGVRPDTRVYVYCKTGVRSGEAVDLLRARGVDAVNVEGGILAWVAEIDPGLPTY